MFLRGYGLFEPLFNFWLNEHKYVWDRQKIIMIHVTIAELSGTSINVCRLYSTCLRTFGHSLAILPQCNAGLAVPYRVKCE